MKGSIGKWYKDNFDRLKVIAPSKAWTNISNHMKTWPAGWYKVNADGLDVEPSIDSWDSIAIGIKSFNAGRKSARLFVYRAAVAILIFAIIPFGFSDMSESVINNTNQVDLAITNSDFSSWIAFDGKSSKPENLNREIVQSERVIQSIIEPIIGNSPIAVVSNPQIVNTPVVWTAEPITDQNEIDPMSLLAAVPINNRLVPIVEPINIPKRDIIVEQDKKWGIGAKVNAHGSTLITPMTSLAMDSEGSVQNPIGLNVSYGLTATYNVNRKHGIEMDLMLNDRKTQRIRNYSDGNYLERRTDLVYSSLSVSYRRNLLNSPIAMTRNHSLYMVSGLYGSYKTSVSELLDDKEINDLSAGYKSMDFGLNLGVDYSVRLTPRLDWSAGIKYQIGVMNVFGGVDKIPASFYRTYTNSLGLTTSVRFKF